MAGVAAASVDWVRTPAALWIARFGIALALAGALAVAFWGFLRGGPPTPPSVVGADLLGLVLVIGFLAFLPTTRRVGVSTAGVALDFGWRTVRVPWPRVAGVRSGWLRVDGPLGPAYYRLTRTQSDRLARYRTGT